MEHSTSDQPTGPTDEPAMLNLDALGGVKAVREAMCVAQVDIGRSGRSMAEAGRGMTLIAKIIDACDVHRPLGPDGKHGTGRCTPTCGCVDKTYPEHGPSDAAVTLTETETSVLVTHMFAAWLREHDLPWVDWETVPELSEVAFGAFVDRSDQLAEQLAAHCDDIVRWAVDLAEHDGELIDPVELVRRVSVFVRGAGMVHISHGPVGDVRR